ncbi:MAG TPA: phosphoglucosamine mutase [Candidatus Dormibacteraeota bacterium]|nr:phosphoglucosamine mutase [Candidatus Dormibacteraeota bacterium]
MTKELFGTDGIRGIPGTYPLDDATLYGVARALGKYLLKIEPKPRVLIGMDTRESGPHIASQLAAGLADDGVAFVSAGVISTPGVACLVREKKFSAGMVISASHNPFHDNGVKLFAGTGMKFPDDVEEHLEIEIHQHKGREMSPHGVPVPADRSLDEEYLACLRGRVIPGAKFSGMKMVLDCANGAASQLAPALFRSLGAGVIAIHDQPNGRNINDGCGSLHPEDLRKKVLETHADLGVAFDGDADRALFVSSSGHHVDGDGILLAAARYLKSVGQLHGGRVIGTTMANLGLERVLESEGLRLARTPVGDRYVLEEMLRSGANLGGEQSGHIIFLDDATTGDGLLTALKIACIVAIRGPLDGLVHGLKVFPQTIINVQVKSKPPLESLPSVSAAIDKATKTLGAAGRVVVRYSGTEPKARVMVEAEHAEDVNLWAETLASAIRTAIGS